MSDETYIYKGAIVSRDEHWVKVALAGDAEAAQWLEDEIERRGLKSEYVFALAAIFHCEMDEWGTTDVFTMMRATPAQRARAFVEATKER